MNVCVFLGPRPAGLFSWAKSRFWYLQLLAPDSEVPTVSPHDISRNTTFRGKGAHVARPHRGIAIRQATRREADHDSEEAPQGCAHRPAPGAAMGRILPQGLLPQRAKG